MAILPRCEKVLFSGHALRRMFERGITGDRVLSVLRNGRVIVTYPDDTPYPTYLVLGFVGREPLHVLVALDESTSTAVVVTAYVPDPDLWNGDFRTRSEP